MNRRLLIKYLLTLPFASSVAASQNSVDITFKHVNTNKCIKLYDQVFLDNNTPFQKKKLIGLKDETKDTNLSKEIEKVIKLNDIKHIVVYIEDKMRYAVVGYGKGFSVTV